MIAHLRGRLLRKGAGDVVIDVSGVGYRVFIPLSTFYRLGEPGAEVELRTHLHVREDVLQLFGFLGEEEQALFEALIGVAGVGPRLALNILSGIEAPDLVQALRAGDVARLTRIPGVGKKTAERLVVELKDKAQGLSAGRPERAAPAFSPTKDDLVSVLANLGYSRPEAEKAVDRVLADRSEAERFEDLLRRALRQLAGRR